MPNETIAQSLASKIADYRLGEIVQPDTDHVLRWAQQFPPEVRTGLLKELDHVLEHMYCSQEAAIAFLDGLLTNTALAGSDPGAFWRQATLLNIQQNGRSQSDMLGLFNRLIEAKHGLADQKANSSDFIYIDDVIFTGNRIGNDLDLWIKKDAPAVATVHIIVLATHSLGAWQLGNRLFKAAQQAGKNINFKTWRVIEIENRKSSRDVSEVLWPVSLPASASEYNSGRFPFEARRPGQTKSPFSSEEGRQLLEGAFVEAGMRIRSFSANPAASMRPLGYGPFGVGFGATIVTYRNCPNNAPLALWWGDPTAGRFHPLSKWLPLVPRKTYG